MCNVRCGSCNTLYPRRSSWEIDISPSRVVTDIKNQNSCSAELGARAYVSIGVPPSWRLGLITRSNLHSSLCFRRVVCWFSYTQLFLSLGAGVLKEVVSSALWQLQEVCFSNCSLQLKKESLYHISGHTICNQLKRVNSFAYSFHLCWVRAVER